MMDLAKVPNWPAIGWMLFVAACLHNLEEALTYGTWRDKSTVLVERLLGSPVVLPELSTFFVLLAAVTALALVVTIWTSRAPATHCKRLALRLFALILLVNVLVPHVPAAVLMGGYAPGVLTAVLINLPLSLYALRKLRAV